MPATLNVIFGPCGAGKTIVHLTDTHFSGDRGELEGFVRLAREQNPDYLFFTGDLIDRNAKRNLPGAARRFPREKRS